MLDRLLNHLPPVIIAMIISAMFTTWAMAFFESTDHANETKISVEKQLDELHADIKAIRESLDYIRGQLSHGR